MANKKEYNPLFFIKELTNVQSKEAEILQDSFNNCENYCRWDEGCYGGAGHCAGACSEDSDSLFTNLSLFSSKGLQDITIFTLHTYNKLPNLEDCKKASIYLQKEGNTDEAILLDKEGVAQRISLGSLGIDPEIVQKAFALNKDASQEDKDVIKTLTESIILAVRQAVDNKAYSMIGRI